MKKTIATAIIAVIVLAATAVGAATVTTRRVTTTTKVTHPRPGLTVKTITRTITITNTITKTVTKPVPGPTVYVDFPSSCASAHDGWVKMNDDDYTNDPNFDEWTLAYDTCHAFMFPSS